ncbi:MAG: fibronectin type III domain-containing protein [Pseudomonadota bacterium]
MVNGIVQLAAGHPVVGAKISAETLSGRKLPLRRKIGATTDRGGYYLETAELPQRFVVVAEGGQVHWRENGQDRVQPLKGAMRAVVTLEQDASNTVQTAMLSLGTTTEVAIYRRLGKKDLARAAELTRRALGWPSWARLGFDDRVNDDFVLGSKVVEALRASGGLKALAARIAKQGVRGKAHLVPYGDSLLAPSSQPAVVQLAARRPSASQSRVQPRELTAVLNAWYNYCIPLVFGKEPALSATQCAVSVILTLAESLGGGGNQSELQQLITAVQADFESLQAQISDLQAVLNQDFAVQTYEAYSSLQAIQTGNAIMNMLAQIQAASALSCQPPGTAVSPTNPPPCGALTYTLFGGPPPSGQNVTAGLLGELNPANNAGFFGGSNPMGAVSFQDQIMGGTAGAQGALYFGQQAIWAAMKVGTAATKGTATSLYTNAMSLGLLNLEQNWFSLMGNLAILNAQYYAYEQWPALAQTVTDARSLQTAVQKLQGEIGAYLQQRGYLYVSSASMGTLAQQQQSWAQLVPPNAVIDPSTSLMWWNTTGTINGDGLTVSTQPVTNNAGCGYIVNDWLNTVNGAENAGCSGWNPPKPQSGRNGSGPTCSSQTATCTGEVHNNWFMPSLQYSFSENPKGSSPGNCTPYSDSGGPLGEIPQSGTVGASSGLLGSVSPSVGTQNSFANVAPGVFPNVGVLNSNYGGGFVAPMGTNCSGGPGASPYTVIFAQLGMNCTEGVSDKDCSKVQIGQSCPWWIGNPEKVDGPISPPYNGTGFLPNFSPNYVYPASQPGDAMCILNGYSFGLVVLSTQTNNLACYVWQPSGPPAACPAEGWLPPAPAGAPTEFKPVYYPGSGIILQLTWNPPADTGGSLVSEYQLQYSSNPEAQKPEWQSVSGITGTSYTLPPLTTCTPYTFRVRAVNASGVAGPAATTIAQYPVVGSNDPPCQPFGLAVYPGNSQAQLSWLAPTFIAPPGFFPGTYLIQYSADNGTSWTQVPGPICSTTSTITGLVNGTSYLFRVAATNTMTEYPQYPCAPQGLTWAQSGWSETVSATPEGPAFSAPFGVNGEAGNGSVALSWSAPTYTGGAQITGYAVQYSSDNGTAWTQVPGTVTGTFTVVSGLTNGTSYVFQIAAVNQFGVQGPWSEKSGPFIPFGPSPTATPAP